MRSVDHAMDQNRAEKNAIRRLWLNEVRASVENYPDDEIPMYLTLPGAEGRDIQLLVEHGLLRLTEAEIRGIVEEDKGKVVAVESNSRAITELQKRFPNLRILRVPINDLIRGEALTSWPQGVHAHLCRARVVNLDLNSPLHAREQEGDIVFPVIRWIAKFAQLHAEPPLDWSLCLTLNGGLVWDATVCRYTKNLLVENFQREPRFAESCKIHLGSALYNQIEAPEDEVDFSSLSEAAQQQVLMILVPKLITQYVQHQGWKIRTQRNLRYQGGGGAPMVTWVVHFTRNSGVSATPNAAYRDALANILYSKGLIRDDGQIEEDL